MPSTIERRRTITRTVSHNGADQMKNNIRNVAEEIARVRDQAREEVSALERIRGMLDTGYLNELLQSVEALETRIEELENDSLLSQESAGKIQEELEAEQDRLQKLWDAYKMQEDELERLKRDYPLMEEKLFDRERQIERLRREVARLEPLSQFKDDYEAAAAENSRLARELDASDSELERTQRTLKSLENEVTELRALEADSHRVRDLENELEEERERLAKLYRVYEDQEAEKGELQERLNEWESWFNRVRPSFEATGQAPSMAPN